MYFTADLDFYAYQNYKFRKLIDLSTGYLTEIRNSKRNLLYEKQFIQEVNISFQFKIYYLITAGITSPIVPLGAKILRSAANVGAVSATPVRS